MPHIDVQHVTYALPDGRVLLDDVSFRVGDGSVAALVGANGCGKSTLMKFVSGEWTPHEGSIVCSGSVAVMPQFIGHMTDGTVRDLLLTVAPERIRKAAKELTETELLMMDDDSEQNSVRYAQAIADWAEVGGYDIEVVWDVCTMAAMGQEFSKVEFRAVGTLSGGEQKRLVLEALFRGPDEILLLDEPDNYLDVPGKRWLENK
ncbi:MAG: hypothetical protein RJA41_27, partial [Actinomycetota bacterium]